MKNCRHWHFGIFALALTMAGCATLMSGKTQSISVSANIDGAEIFLDGILIGRTPFTGAVRKNKSQLRVQADGYRSEDVALSKSLDPVFWGNIIIGGTLGSVTDFATGAAYQYAPASYQVVLRAEGQSDASYSRELGVQKFGMIYIDYISRDIASGEGDYLSALQTLSKDDGGNQISRDAVKGALEASRGEQVEFGRLLVDLL